MKKVIILFILLMLILCGCNSEPNVPVQPTAQPTSPTTAQSGSVPTTSPTAVPTEALTQAPAQQKVLLELREFKLDESSYEGMEAETEEISILLEDLVLPETALKTYENDPFLSSVAATLEKEVGLTLDEHWKFYIHYYTPEQDQGTLAMTYWVDGIIATNRAVTIHIDNGTAHTAVYSYLDSPLDEETLLKKYEHFINTHEQQRENLLGEGFEINAESTLYTYNFRTDQLRYTYNIFYRHIETGIIDNSYGTELVIE